MRGDRYRKPVKPGWDEAILAPSRCIPSINIRRQSTLKYVKALLDRGIPLTNYLTPKQASWVIQNLYEGKSTAEIGKQEGITHQSVSQQLYGKSNSVFSKLKYHVGRGL